jgi:glyoxylase-like metal-dependent hydrolase (beta-lactamase superfamily II)
MAFSKVATSKLPLPPKEILPDIFAFAPNPDSFGGVSYLIMGDKCNFMVDVPEYANRNIRFIEENDPPEFIFLTHRDDVADTEMFREKFGPVLIIQESEKYAVKSPALTFKDSLEIGGAEIIHTPGHSPGSSCLLYSKKEIMFTGDHGVVSSGRLAVEEFY